MPRNTTTGVFTRVSNSFSAPVAGTLIDPTDADALWTDYDAGLNAPQVITTGGTGAASTLTLQSTSGAGTTDKIIFKTASQTFAGKITTGQQWYIGTTDLAPPTGVALTVSKNTGALPALLSEVASFAAADGVCTRVAVQNFGIGGSAPGYFTSAANGTAAARTATVSGDNLGILFSYGFKTAGGAAYITGAGGGLVLTATENFDATHAGEQIAVYTTPNGTVASAIAATFNSSGGLSVGTTTDAGVGAVLANTSVKSKSASAGIGYATGAGNVVTQTGSRTTSVAVNAVCGAITLFSAAGSATPASFTVTNTSVAATDVVHVAQKSGTDLYEIFVTNIADNSFKITFFTTGGTTTEQPVFNFVIIKGVTS